jgi:hypothetical protein
MKMSKKSKVFLLLALSIFGADTTFALEFQPLGSIGMGGAGVARTFDGTAAYWNPGALAFEADKNSFKFGGSVGYRIDDNLAVNVDRLSNLENPGDINLTNRDNMGQIIQLVGVMGEMRQAGNNSLQLNGDTVIGMRIGNFGTGIFGTLQGAGTPDLDLANIRPTGISSVADLASAIGADGSGTRSFFTQQQFDTIALAFGNGATGSDIALAFDQQLTASNVSQVSANSATAALIRIADSINTGTGTIDNNQSTLQTRGLAYFEVPLAYGYPIDLGRFGKLGIGGAAKIMAGRVYINNTTLFETTSGDIFRNITRDSEDSLSWGIDVGALWKWHNVNVGVVAKNLNTPEFSTNELVPGGDEFKIRPQVRGGMSVDVFKWLSVAADIDITKNETNQPGVKSQNFGGGLEFRPADWCKIRMGAFKNIDASGSSPIATAGLSIGPKWFNLELDAAVSPETSEYKGTSYPREGKVQLSFNSQF